MPGFPGRPSRDAFGPTMDTSRVPVIPTRDVGGAQFNLEWWQTAGAGLMVPLAWVGIAANGARTAAAEAWNANQNGTLHPTVVHGATGFYLVAFNAYAPNELGNLVALGLQWVDCAVQMPTNGPWSANGAFVTPVPWTQSASWQAQEVVTTAAGNTYFATTGGEGASSGAGPTGQGTGIVDNNARWSYVGPTQNVGLCAVISVSDNGYATDAPVLVKFR
jgi:hypothetical protein